jgi:chromosomal replication initiation ATPase DnaA
MYGTLQEWVDGFEKELQKRFSPHIRLFVTKNLEGDGAMKTITTIAAHAANVPYDKIVNKRRGNVMVSEARMLAIYLINLNMKVPKTRIAAFMANRNHATIIHALRTADSRISTNDDLFTSLLDKAQAYLSDVNLKNLQNESTI